MDDLERAAQDAELNGEGGAPPSSLPWWLLAGECAFLFGALPLVYALGLVRIHLFAGLALFASYCLFMLLRDPLFDRRQLWNARAIRTEGGKVVVRFILPALGLLAVVFAFARDDLFSLPLHRPGLWAVIMVGYPIFSVYPQEVIFRTFFFHRYRRLFPRKWALVATSAVAFALAHIMFKESWIAMGLTLIGGVLFATTYLRTRSTMLVWMEHTLYGCLVFTIGLGEWFYLGAAR